MRRPDILAKTDWNRAALTSVAASLVLGMSGCGSKHNFGDTMSARFDDFAAKKIKDFPSSDLRTLPIHSSIELSRAGLQALPRENLSDLKYYGEMAAIECGAVAMNGLAGQPDEFDPNGPTLASAGEYFLDGLTLASISIQNEPKSQTNKRLANALEDYQYALSTCDGVLAEEADVRTLVYPVGLK